MGWPFSMPCIVGSMLPRRRIATLNDDGNSGSSIATPSKLHKRHRGGANNLLEPPGGTPPVTLPWR